MDTPLSAPDSWMWMIPALFGICFAGLGYMIVQALRSGAEAYSNAYSEQASRQFEDIFLFIPAQRITDISWSLASLIFLLTFFAVGDVQSEKSALTGILVAGVVAGLFLNAPAVVLSWLKGRRLHRFNVQLVDALVTMSNSLKAGFSITQAIETVVRNSQAPLSQEFAVFLHETRVGVPFDDALRNIVERVRSDDLVLVAMAIETARITGGNLTEVFDSIAGTIRERMRIEGRIQTLTAQGRLQGIVIGVMPILLAIMMIVIDPEMMLPFLRSRIGLIVVGAVIILETVGFLAIRKIVRIDV
ncbi:MAG: type II secretion system F family protein [Verrucomicrobia bacterium]|nr:type II secretion system F family protein [Verrucomicrobiota bacterium]MDA1085532.1 type II secretion system F family protein [Verrucomicrobiota bacterium]